MTTTTEAEQQLVHLANSLPMLAGLTSETRAELLELAGEFARHYHHPDATPETVARVPIDFLSAAVGILRAPPLPPLEPMEY